MPPLLADFTHARACNPICEKSLTLPLNSDKRLLSKLMNRINDNDLEDIISSPCAFNIASYKHVVNL